MNAKNAKDLRSVGIEVGQGKYHEEIVYSTALLHSLLTNHISAFMRKHGLNPAKFNIMMVVKHQGREKGINQVDVSRQLVVTPSNMTKMVDRLEKEGMVKRFAQEGDKRVNLLKITPEGSKILDKVWKGYNDKLKELLSGLSQGKQRQLSSLLQEWLQGLK